MCLDHMIRVISAYTCGRKKRIFFGLHGINRSLPGIRKICHSNE